MLKWSLPRANRKNLNKVSNYTGKVAQVQMVEKAVVAAVVINKQDEEIIFKRCPDVPGDPGFSRASSKRINPGG